MQSKYIKKTACPECGSKDNLAWFDDGHAYCFSVDCEYTFYPNKEKKSTPLKLVPPPPFKPVPVDLLKVTSLRRVIQFFPFFFILVFKNINICELKEKSKNIKN